MMLLLADGAKNLIVVCIVVGLIVVIAFVVLLFYLSKTNGGKNHMCKSKGKGEKPAEQKSQEEKKQARQERREQKTYTEEQGGGNGFEPQISVEVPKKLSKSIERLRKKELRNRVHELEGKLKVREEQIARLEQGSESKQESERKYLVDAIRDVLSEFWETWKASVAELETLKTENESLRQANQAWEQKETDWQTEHQKLFDSAESYKEQSKKCEENITKIIGALSEFLRRWNDACAELKVDAMVSSSCDTTEDVCRILSNEISGALDQMKESCDAQKSLREKIESLSSELETIATSPKQIDNAEYGEWWRKVEGLSYSLLIEIKKSMNYAVLIVDEDVREQSYRDINERLDCFLKDVTQEDLRRKT